MGFFRAAFLLLVFANLVFFAWAQGYFGELGGGRQGREPQRLASQLAADKLRIVAAGPAEGEKAAAARPAADQPACRFVSSLAAADAEALRTALTAAGFAVELKTASPQQASYWVHIPPLANKAAAEKKSAELRALGVKDFYIVGEEGPSRNAISLGLFQNEAGANEFLQGLGKRGVRSARIEVREKPPQAIGIVVRGAVPALDARLAEQVARTPGMTIANCP